MAGADVGGLSSNGCSCSSGGLIWSRPALRDGKQKQNPASGCRTHCQDSTRSKARLKEARQAQECLSENGRTTSALIEVSAFSQHASVVLSSGTCYPMRASFLTGW